LVLSFSREIGGSLGVVLNLVLLILNPCGSNYDTFFQTQKLVGLVQN
jgi:hypothetical protein